jgi:hypothetical protein
MALSYWFENGIIFNQIHILKENINSVGVFLVFKNRMVDIFFPKKYLVILLLKKIDNSIIF